MVTGDGSPGVTRHGTEPHDATERRRAEEAALESGTILRALLESASEAVVIVGGDGRIVLFSARAEEMFGYSRDELLNQPVEILMPALFRKAHDNHRADYVTHPRVRPMGPGLDLVGRRKDGTEFPVEIGLSFIETDGAGLTMSLIADISERRRAEAALRESEANIADIAGSLKEVVWSASPNTFETLYVNAAAEAVYGRPVAEFLANAHLWLEVIHPEDKERLARQVQASSGGDLRELEYRILRPDGEVRWLHGQAHLARDTSGHVTRIVGITTDITERKQAEEALRESEERFRSAFEHAAIGMALVGTDGRILQANQSLCEMLGYSEEELTSTTWQTFTHPDDLDIGLDLMRRTLAGEMDTNQIEKRYLHKLGHVVWAQLSFSLVRGDDGSPLHFISQIQDITERKRAEEALRDSKLLLEKTFASLDEAVFVMEPNTRTIIACNSAAERIFGYSEKEMIGRNTEFLHVNRAMYTEFSRKLFSALEADGVFHTEYQVRRKDGSVLSTEHTMTEIVDDSGQRTGVVSVLRDVTEHKRMEEQLQVAREELEGRVERQMLRRNPYGLTFRELTILNVVAAGKSGKEIATELGISPLTVQKHLSNILAKMDASSRTEAVARGLREGLLD